MFNVIKSENNLLNRLPKRASPIKKLSKLPLTSSTYLNFVTNHLGCEITPDILLFGYEEALQENKIVQEAYPTIGNILWLIGSTGQGDSWFLDRATGFSLFFDHQQGEYEKIEHFTNLNISFVNFLSMAFLYADLEKILDLKDLSENEIKAFEHAVNGIHPGLYSQYPFDYFK